MSPIPIYDKHFLNKAKIFYILYLNTSIFLIRITVGELLNALNSIPDFKSDGIMISYAIFV